MQEVSQKQKSVEVAFNLASYETIQMKDAEEFGSLNEKHKEHEDELYKEITKNLEEDLTNLGMEVNYSSRIIIGEVAMNMVLVERAKFQAPSKSLLSEDNVLRKSGTSYNMVPYSNKKYSQAFYYDWFPENHERIHVVFEKLIPQLQKQIHQGLKDLGLLPNQQIERQKLTIVKKLRQRFGNMNGSEVTVEAKSEKNIH